MVKKQYLVLIAALVWAAAGINILRIGAAAALAVTWEWWMILAAVGVFLLFGAMFLRIVGKTPAASTATTPPGATCF